jgi:hypothetical protein
MNQTAKLALIIGGIVSALAGLATLGVVYAKFEKAQKTVKQTTLGDVLKAEKLNSKNVEPKEPEEVIPVFAEGDVEKAVEDLATEVQVEVTVFDEKVVTAAKDLEKKGRVVSIDDKKEVPKNG